MKCIFNKIITKHSVSLHYNKTIKEGEEEQV